MNLTKLAIVAAGLFAAYKFAPHAIVKGAAVSIGAVVAAKQIPYLNDLI